MTDQLTQKQREALEALEYVAQAEDAVSVIHQIRFRAEIERIRTCILNSTPVPEGWSVYRNGEAIMVDDNQGNGAMLEPENGRARLDTLYQFFDAWLAAAPTPEDSHE